MPMPAPAPLPLFGADPPLRSVFERHRLADLYGEIQQIYRQLARPWVLGFSAGKDSTTLVQLIWSALAALPAADLRYPLYVIATDTLVEDPAIRARMTTSLARMNVAARAAGLPLSAHQLQPAIDQSFWVNILGRAYPPPTNRQRWCTDRLKIQPGTRFIKDLAARGEILLALGSRTAESTARRLSMQKDAIPDQILHRHRSLPQAAVYYPLADWTTEDIWLYLLNQPSPWGDTNRDLAALYAQASGECPLVIDLSTPTCGHSRFGCWTCTLVATNRSLEAQIDHGADWAIPLTELRDYLYELTLPENKPATRELRGRRDGRVRFKPDGTIRYRCLTRATVLDLLRRVLQTQRALRDDPTAPAMEVITWPELVRIREIWRYENAIWDDPLPALYGAILGAPPAPWPPFDDSFLLCPATVDRLRARYPADQIPAGLVLQPLPHIYRDLYGRAAPPPWHRYLDSYRLDRKTERLLTARFPAGTFPLDLAVELISYSSPYARPPSSRAYNRQVRALLAKDRRPTAQILAADRPPPPPCQLALPFPQE